MVNVLIADDNIDYAINLMNYINNKNENIKVCNIAKDGKETVEILNAKNSIDVILLDYKMPIYNGEEILKMVKDKEKYVQSCIIISGEIEKVVDFKKSEMIYSIIYKTVGMNEIIKKINELIEYKEKIIKTKKYKDKIINEILYLRFDISHKGTKYLVETIEYIILNPKQEYEKLEKDIYPKIAKKHNDTVHNIKCRINRAVNTMYYNCEVERLKEYFSFYIDTKPKIKTIISTIINKIM